MGEVRGGGISPSTNNVTNMTFTRVVLQNAYWFNFRLLLGCSSSRFHAIFTTLQHTHELLLLIVQHLMWNVHNVLRKEFFQFVPTCPKKGWRFCLSKNPLWRHSFYASDEFEVSEDDYNRRSNWFRLKDKFLSRWSYYQYTNHIL